jgi:L-fuconolactonase
VLIIDCQVHAYEANTPKRPWHTVPNWPDHVTGDEMVAAMDRVGVHGAIFISAFSLYRYDGSYAVEVQQAHPGRFAIVNPSIPTILRWAMSLPTGRRRQARSASASS